MTIRDGAASLATLLKLTGNETYTAHDGLEAMEAAERFRPDVVLLDIGLPKLNGRDDTEPKLPNLEHAFDSLVFSARLRYQFGPREQLGARTDETDWYRCNFIVDTSTNECTGALRGR